MKIRLEPTTMADLGVVESATITVDDDWSDLPPEARRVMARAMLAVEQEALMREVREAYGDVLLAGLVWKAGGWN